MLNNLVTKKDPEKPEQEYVTQESLQALLKAKDSNIDALNDKVAEFQRYSDSVEALWKEASGENRNLRLMFTKSYAKDFDRTEAERERKKIEILQKLDDLRRERNRLQIQLQRRQQDSDDFHVETKKVHQQLQAEIDNYRKKVVSLREELDNAEAQSRQTEEEDRTMIQELHTKLKKLQSKEGEVRKEEPPFFFRVHCLECPRCATLLRHPRTFFSNQGYRRITCVGFFRRSI